MPRRIHVAMGLWLMCDRVRSALLFRSCEAARLPRGGGRTRYRHGTCNLGLACGPPTMTKRAQDLLTYDGVVGLLVRN